MAAPGHDAAPPHISLGLSLGVLEVGVLFSAVLYGAALVQAYVYVSAYPKDRGWVKAVVAFVCCVETLHSMCQWAYLYYLSVIMFGDPHGLNRLPWYFVSSIPLQALSGAAVQAFFSYRVQTLSGKWWLALPGYIGQAIRIALDIAILVTALKAEELSVFQRDYGHKVDVALIISAATDLWNTLLLCIYLRHLKSSYTSTKNAIHSIMLFTIETGLLTSACAIIIVVCWVTMPSNGVWAAINMIYPKLFSNSLLVTLNKRASLGGEIAAAGESVAANTHEIDVRNPTSFSGDSLHIAFEHGSNVSLETIPASTKKRYRLGESI